MLSDYTHKLNRNITIYYISSALSGLLFTVPVWVAFHQQYLSYSQMALVAAVAYGVTLVLELPTGALADLIGRKKTIIIGQLTIGIFRILLGFATTPIMFYVAWIGEAVGNALVSGSDTAILYDSLKDTHQEERFPRIVAKSSLVRRSLLVFAVFSGGYLYQFFVGLPFILRGSAYLAIAIVSLWLTEPKIDTYIFSFKNYILQTKEGFKHLFRSTQLKISAYYYGLAVGVIWVLQDYFVNTFAKDSGYTETQQSWMFSSFYLISTLVVLYITRNKDKMPNKHTIYVSVSLLLALALLPGYFASKFLVYFLILLINITSAIKGALLDNYVNQEIDSKYRATSMSSLNLLVSAVYMLILVITGPLQDAYSNRAVWSLLGIVILVLLFPLTWRLVSTNIERVKNEPNNKA